PMDLIDALSERLRAALPGGSAAPFTIGDVYQRLIPYRAVRGDLGVIEFAAYEHALLPLLAGEGGDLELRDPRAREEFERELASVNPIVGIYRDYAEAELHLSGRPAPADVPPGVPADTDEAGAPGAG